jgi:D-alanine-D-alanine ligase
MGGDYVYSYIKGAWGVDMIEYAVKIAIGEYIKIQKPAVPNRYIIGKDFLSEYSGILVKMQVDDRLKQEKCVDEIHFYKQIGEPVFAPPEGYDFVGWVTVTGDSMIDAQDNLNRIMKYINYEVVKFDPASSIGKTQRRNRFSNALLDTKSLARNVRIASIRKVTKTQLRKLHIGIACNIYEGEGGAVEADLMSIGKNIESTLHARGYKVTFFDFNNLGKAFNDIRTSNVDLIFNVCERINDSSLLEPHAASILDTLQIPYTGSNPFTLALCIDKIRVKKLLSFHNIPTPKWDYAYEMDDDIRDDLQYPLIVKPSNTDNSIGITNDSIVTNKKELYRQLEKIIVGLKTPALIEEYIEGDEYDVAILGSEYDDLRVLPLARSIFADLPKGFWHIYPYDAKWAEGGVYDKIKVQRPPKNISRRLQSLITEIALDTYNILDCHDYGRVEIRVDKDNNPYILELNPNPSINIGDSVHRCAELVGMDYGDFIEEIIALAIKRYKNRPPYHHLQANLI